MYFTFSRSFIKYKDVQMLNLNNDTYVCCKITMKTFTEKKKAIFDLLCCNPAEPSLCEDLAIIQTLHICASCHKS